MPSPPPDRCGFAWPADADAATAEPAHASCCARETWRDADRCVWHAEIGGQKRLTDLRGQRETAENRALAADAPGDGPVELLDGARLSECELGDVDLAGVALRDATVRGGALPAATLDDALLVDATLFKAALPDASLEGADLSEAYLSHADLAGASLDGAVGVDATAHHVDLTGASLREVDLHGASLRGVDAESAFLRDAKLPGASLRGATLADAWLDPVDLAGADLEEAVLRGADLAGATLTDADLHRSDLTDAALRDADLSRARLEHAVLTRADAFGATLAGAHLEGTVLADVQVNAATFANAGVPDDAVESESADGHETVDGDPDASPVADGGPLAESSERSLGRRVAAAVRGPTGPDGARCSYDPKSPLTPPSRDGTAPPEVRAAAVYRRLEDLARTNAFPGWQRHYFVLRQDMQTRQYRRLGARTDYLFAALQRTLFGYGESFRRVLGWSAAVVVAFAVVYLLSGAIRPVTPDGDLGEPVAVTRLGTDPGVLWDALYYSTLTFTSLGFGDYRPMTTLGQVVTVAETAIGATLLALLVFVLGRRAAR